MEKGRFMYKNRYGYTERGEYYIERRLNLLVKAVVWAIFHNVLDIIFVANGYVEMTSTGGSPARTKYIFLILYVTFFIWEYFDPFIKWEIEKSRKYVFFSALGWSGFVLCMGNLVSALIFPIPIAGICWIFDC
jgi:hypothetical protein